MNTLPARSPRAILILFVLAILPALLPSEGLAQVPRPDAASSGTFARAWGRATPATVSGELTVMYADDFANHRAARLYFLKDLHSGRVVQVQFDRPPANLRTGSHVTLSGRSTDDQLFVLASQVDASESAAAAPATAAATAATTPGQRTLAIVADFTDACVTCSPGDVANALFSDPGGLSASALYADNSRGQVVLGGDVVGPYPIGFASTDPCDLGALAKAADASATAAGVNLAAYQRRVYVMPTSNCPGAGFGTVGGSPSYAWIFVCTVRGLYAHELGHNLGMDHAATPTSEYGDGTDPMSLSENLVRGLNAPHRQQLGFLDSQATRQITQPGSYDLSALALDPALATAPRILTLAKPDTGEFYYVSYREPEGYDNYIDSSYFDRLSIHRYKGDGSAAKTYLVARLADGERFTDPVNGIAISLLSHGATGAVAGIELACAARAPSLVLSPAAQSGAPGGSASYSLSITSEDAGPCSASTYVLSASAPSGWKAAVSPASLTLGPAASGQAVLTVTSPASQPVGSYQVAVNAADAALAVHSVVASATYTVTDVIPPSAPAALKAVANSKAKSIALTWTASTDNVGVVGYRVSRNGTLVGTTSGTSWTDTAYSAGATYTYSVTAYDAAGNQSGASNGVSVTISGGTRKK